MEEAHYSSTGSRALLFNGGSGQVYYPSGRVAVVVASSTTSNGVKFQRYFYEDDAAGTLLGSIDERVIGGARDNRGSDSGLRFVSTSKGGLVSTNGGRILHQWKHDRKAQDAGKLPPLPLRITMNDFLTLVFKGREDIMVTFRCEGLVKEFQCGEQLRRIKSYLDGCKRKSDGKIVPDMIFKTLQERQLELAEEQAHVRNKSRPCSKNIRHSAEVRAVMKGIESQMEPWERKIRNGDYSDTFLDSRWKDDAHVRTMREIPRLLETGHETGQTPEGCSTGLGTMVSRQDLEQHGDKLSLQQALPERWPSEVQIRQRARQENPIMKRSSVLRSASGRYSTSLPVQMDLHSMEKLPTLVPETFDDALNSQPGKVVIVVCLRDDDLLCARARQLCEKIRADSLAVVSSEKSNQRDQKEENRLEEASRLSPCAVYQFAMTHSRYMTERFGVQTLPCFLAFYGGRLVKASIMGSKPLNLLKESNPPRMLIVEPTRFKSQLQIEKLLRRLHYESELAISARDALEHIKFRGGMSSPGVVTFYGLVFVDSDVSPAEVRTIVQQARKVSASASRGATLVVSLLPMGCKPQKDLEEGIVKAPTTADLIEGICDVAVTRPLKSTTMDRLLTKFVALQKESRGKEAADPQENFTHYGFKKADLRREINQAYADANQSRFMDANFKLGMKLSANRAVFRGVRLED